MTKAVSSRKLRLILVLAMAGTLSGCVTNPYTGEKEFTPWKALKKADDNFGDLIEKSNTSPDPRQADWWNPD